MTTTFTNALSDSSLSRVLITPESTWGEATTAADNGFARVLPFTSESLTYTPTTIASSTITQRRTQSDLILANLQAEGDIEGEFTATNFDGLLKAALLSSGSTSADPLTWELINTTPGNLGVLTLTDGYSYQNITTDIDGGKSQINYTASSTAIRGALSGLAKGQAITVAGAAVGGGAANGTYTVLRTVTSSSGTVITLVENIGSSNSNSIVNENSSTTTITSQRIADGNAVDSVSRQSFAIEKQLRLGGTNNKYFLYRGMMVNNLTFSVSAQELATISLSFIGKDSEAYETGDAQFAAINTAANATGLSSANLAAAAVALGNQSVNGSDDFNGIYQDGVMQGLVSSFSLTINNNLRPQNALGVLGAVSVGVGTSEITGSVDVFLKDLSMYKKFIANETSSLQFRFSALDHNNVSQTYQVYLPRIKFSNVEQPISANNTDVITTGTFQALHDDASNASIVISKA